MADPVAVTRFALSTAAAGNTQDITISGFGTPKAAMFIFGLPTADDTIANAGRFGVGFTDGTNENVVDIDVASGGSTSNTERGHRTDCVINLTQTAASVVRFSFNSWITDGVRLDIDDATGAAYLVTCILFSSSEVSNAHVGFKDDLGTGTSAIDINTVGFEPDLVFMTNVGLSTAPNAHSAEALLSFGVGHNDGFDTQRVALVSSKSAVGTADSTAYIGNDSVTGQAYSGTLNWDAVIGSYDASGFSITPNSSSSSDVVFYLCLKFTNSPDIKLFDMSWPTSGNYAETTPGFEPTFGLITSVQGPASRNTVDNTSVYSLSIAAFDDSSIYTQTATDKDGVGTMVSKGLSSDQLRILDFQGVNDAVLASSYAFDADGWDFTLSTNPGSAVLGWGLAIGAGGGTDTNVLANTETLALTPYAASIALDVNVATNLATLSLTEYAASITYDVDVQANAETLTLTTYQASIQADVDTNVITNLATLTLTENQASISFDREIQASTYSLSLTENPATISFDVDIQASTETMVLTGLQAGISGGAALQAYKVNGILV